MNYDNMTFEELRKIDNRVIGIEPKNIMNGTYKPFVEYINKSEALEANEDLITIVSTIKSNESFDFQYIYGVLYFHKKWFEPNKEKLTALKKCYCKYCEMLFGDKRAFAQHIRNVHNITIKEFWSKK